MRESFAARNAKTLRTNTSVPSVGSRVREGFMGNVIVLYRILPDSPEHFDTVKKELEDLKPDKLEEDPIGFGLKALKFTKVIADAPRTEEDLENTVRALPHIQTVETLAVTRSF